VSTFAFLAATALAGFATGTLYSRAAIRRLTTDLADAVHRATHDPLTGLPNRAAVPELFALASTADAAPAVILIDLDGFKEVNDTHGHHAGDQLLVTVGRRLASATGVLGGSAIRLGGDEFLLILPPAHTDMATAVACALFRPSATVQLDSHHGPVGLHPRCLRAPTTPSPPCSPAPMRRCTTPSTSAAAATRCTPPACAATPARTVGAAGFGTAVPACARR
jgi:GGDEF domain-containing protein